MPDICAGFMFYTHEIKKENKHRIINASIKKTKPEGKNKSFHFIFQIERFSLLHYATVAHADDDASMNILTMTFPNLESREIVE